MADGSPPDPGSPEDPRAVAAGELARALATAGGQRTLRDLQRLGLLASPDEPPRPSAPPSARPSEPTGPRPISIWTPRQEGGKTVWTRPPRLPLGDHYADVPELREKAAGRRRIVFFGESAAAGYLYAPHRTPAQVLAAQLRQVSGDLEVIDLARTNETLASLVETVRAARQLSPDLLAIYAGNNWSLLETPEISPYPPSVRGRQSYAETLQGGGLLEPARRARERLAGLASAALAGIAELAAGIPVVLVVPEVNLDDWETRQPVPWLPGDQIARWYAAYDRARASLAAGRPAEARLTEVEAAAWEMVGLDGGSGPVPFRLLAAALRAQGREGEARDAAISEVDSVHYPLLAFLAAPQATTLARELLLATAASRAAAGWSAVDLRRVFADWTGSVLPGRRLFLDYCHLTIEGMEVAMAAVAAEALRLLGISQPDWRDLVRRSPDPLPPGADAAAKLGAAIHTAHRMLPVAGSIAPLLAHWIEAALDASPAAADALADLADARTAPLATVLSAAQQRNLDSPCRLEQQHGWVYDFLDADVLAAGMAALARRGDPRGLEIRREIERLLVARLAIGERGADLASPRFHAEPLARFYPELIGERDAALHAHYRAPWPESGFVLVVERARDLSLALTGRLPVGEDGAAGAERRGTVRFEVNGRWAGNVELGARWSTRSLQIAGALLRPGLNRVALRWPPPPPRGEAFLAAAVRRLEEGLPADLHPVFGEVWSLLARPA